MITEEKMRNMLKNAQTNKKCGLTEYPRKSFLDGVEETLKWILEEGEKPIKF